MVFVVGHIYYICPLQIMTREVVCVQSPFLDEGVATSLENRCSKKKESKSRNKNFLLEG